MRSNPDLDATAPVAERVGGVDALRLDVAAVPGASTCVAGNVPVRVRLQQRTSVGNARPRACEGVSTSWTFPAGSVRALVIMIKAPEAAFERVVQNGSARRGVLRVPHG